MSLVNKAELMDHSGMCVVEVSRNQKLAGRNNRQAEARELSVCHSDDSLASGF